LDPSCRAGVWPLPADFTRKLVDSSKIYGFYAGILLIFTPEAALYFQSLWSNLNTSRIEARQ